MTERAKVVLVHFRRSGANKGLPWTVHYDGRCIPASSVEFRVPAETIYRPDKKDQPKAWMRARGVVKFNKNKVIISPGAPVQPRYRLRDVARFK